MSSQKKSEAEGEKEAVYFWKPEQEDGYLGQWYPSPWTVEGERYATAEMWMMVGKARLFNDEVTYPSFPPLYRSHSSAELTPAEKQEVAKEILAADNPRKQKALGRKVRNFDGGVWDKSKCFFSRASL